MKYIIAFCLFLCWSFELMAIDYHVGPTQSYQMIGEVPWEDLKPGDRVYIHWRNTPYREKWVINAKGTDTERIEIIGVHGPEGQKPVIHGEDAITPRTLNYWNESRGVIKIGGSSIPQDGLPEYITIENLEIRSGYEAYSFTNDRGQIENYSRNAAGIYVEKCAHLIIRNCAIHDNGNGIFIGAFNGMTNDVLIEKNEIYGNGVVDDIFEHNTYTEAINIVYQFNHFGSLREGARGNNLKDRSAGLIVRYNWIEDGNRQLDLVDAEGNPELVNHSSYGTTLVYGNILIEPEGAGNSQIIHYGGDSGNLENYRKGKLYFYNNTVISTRSGFTTVVRMSSEDESAEFFNNVFYTTAAGNNLAMITREGKLSLHHNWIIEDWKETHDPGTGEVSDDGFNIFGNDPMFLDFSTQNFIPMSGSDLIDGGGDIPSHLLPDHEVLWEFRKGPDRAHRINEFELDLGAFEKPSTLAIDAVSDFQEIKFYPNPCKNSLSLISLHKKSVSIEIVNSKGADMAKLTFVNEISLDIANWIPGIYFIHQVKNGRRMSSKVIKI